MDSAAAISHVKQIFGQYRRLFRRDNDFINGLVGGKLYEFYCLAKTIEALKSRYNCRIRLVGSHIQFQSSPGAIHSNDPHFEVAGFHGQPRVDIYTDVEFETLGSSHNPVTDFSGQHELDIIAVAHGLSGKPKHDQILLGVECKSNAKFGKWILKQTLGVRRELSYYSSPLQPCALDQLFSPVGPGIVLNANPPSEYWLAYVDPRGNRYDESPATFGIAFKHWEP
jgi:hypothetical protein